MEASCGVRIVCLFVSGVENTGEAPICPADTKASDQRAARWELPRLRGHLTRRVGAEGVAKSFHLVRMRLATRRLTSTRPQRKQKPRILLTSRMSRSRDQVKTSERAALSDHP